jgi:hypothetical protein
MKTIGDHLQAALEIGSVQAQAGDGVEMVEGDLVRMSIVVADPRRDERNAGLGRIEQCGTAAGVRAMVADLQDIHPAQQSALGQHRFDRRLSIAGQQRAETAVAEEADHGGIVDVASGERPCDVIG